jgi:hypothetical protein
MVMKIRAVVIAVGLASLAALGAATFWIDDKSNEGPPASAPKIQERLPGSPEEAEAAGPATLHSPRALRNAELLDRLTKAYPDFLAGYEGVELIWRDGSRLTFDDGKTRSRAERLFHPTLRDQFRDVYPMGRNFDPGRVRYAPFYTKMYGDCSKRETVGKLVVVEWVPKHGGKKVKVTSINGVADRLRQVSADLDRLPALFSKYLTPVSAVYNCRITASGGRRTMHGYGAAVDINARFGDHWAWAGAEGDGTGYRNRIPWEIVEAFERHGFIWGGKWSHFETMHFEYRPELLAGQ